LFNLFVAMGSFLRFVTRSITAKIGVYVGVGLINYLIIINLLGVDRTKYLFTGTINIGVH
jgi:hypothetical protein